MVLQKCPGGPLNILCVGNIAVALYVKPVIVIHLKPIGLLKECVPNMKAIRPSLDNMIFYAKSKIWPRH